jgi:type VI secretion system protein ImpK
MTKNEILPKHENLAFVFQEVLTAIARLRANRQVVSDSSIFRGQIKEALNLADQEARRLGYSTEAVRLAIFAMVVFLDESVLNQQVPVFADWARKPLQEELFGVHVGGEIFFENLTRLLGNPDASELADVLEVHQLCLLLGFRGCYGMSSQGELRSMIGAVEEKIRRIRGFSKDLSPAWALPPNETPPSRPDRWGRPLLFVFVGALFVALVLFIGFRVSLGSGSAALQTLAAETKR